MDKNTMTPEQLTQFAEYLKANPEARLNVIKASKKVTSPIGDGISVAVAPKGGISVYGLNARFPVTLYIEQWKKLGAAFPNLLAFGAANSDKLSVKGK